MNKSSVRIIMFVIICAGLIYWLSSLVQGPKNSEIKSSFVNNQFLPQLKEKTRVQVLGETIEQAIPEVVKIRFGEVGEKIFKTGEKVIEETEMIQEVKKIIENATSEIEGFPEKQKKDLEKEIIRQVYDRLMKEYE